MSPDGQRLPTDAADSHEAVREAGTRRPRCAARVAKRAGVGAGDRPPVRAHSSSLRCTSGGANPLIGYDAALRKVSIDPGEDDRLLKVAEAIADGRSVSADSSDAATGASDALARELRILGVLASVHRAAALGDGSSSWVEAVAVAEEVAAPAEWGPFRVLKELGRGTFGTVYRRATRGSTARSP